MIIIPGWNWRAFSKTKHSYTYPKFQTTIASPLGVLDHLHLGASSGVSELELGMIPGHDWEECGSYKVIWLSDLKSEVARVLTIMCV